MQQSPPVYLKTGNSALEGRGLRPTSAQVEDIFAQVEIVAEFLDRYGEGLRQSAGGRYAVEPTPVIA